MGARRPSSGRLKTQRQAGSEEPGCRRNTIAGKQPREEAAFWQVCRTHEGSIWQQVAGTRKWSSGFLRAHLGGFILVTRLGSEDRAAAPGRPSGCWNGGRGYNTKRQDRKNSAYMSSKGRGGAVWTPAFKDPRGTELSCYELSDGAWGRATRLTCC